MNNRSKTLNCFLRQRGWIAGACFLSVSLVVAKVPLDKPSGGEKQATARAILTRMAEYLSKTPHMSVTVHAAYDAVQQSGYKVEWNEIRKVTLRRPDQLRIDAERSDGARSMILFDGKNITTFDESRQVYAQASQPGGVDETVIHFVNDMGMRLPLAVFFLSRLPEELRTRVQTVSYVEKTTTLGVPADHLAGRTNTVDFQLWIAEGDKPLPVRAVLTYRNAPGQPQFRAGFEDWDLSVNPPEKMFAFTPPAQAHRIPFVSALPHIGFASRSAPTRGARQ
jgi:hypothetical protein